jgi:hypothetical protein
LKDETLRLFPRKPVRTVKEVADGFSVRAPKRKLKTETRRQRKRRRPAIPAPPVQSLLQWEAAHPN